MRKILIINGHQHWNMSPGGYNRALVEEAVSLLTGFGHSTKVSVVDSDWDVETEIERFVWCDDVIYQFPVYWFGVPWALKKYIDEVYMYGRGRIFQDDGRTRSDPSRKYGDGGLLQPRRYMLSMTWNAPVDALEGEGELFEERGADGVFFWFHKANQFCGMTGLPSFNCNDVMKAPDLNRDCSRWRGHLAAHWSNADPQAIQYRTSSAEQALGCSGS